MTDAQELLDRQDIIDVLHRLGRWLDGRGGDPTAIYDTDVVVHSPRGEIVGIERAIEVAAPSDDPTERTQHLLSDVLVDVVGDTAVVTANQLVRFFRPGEAPWRTSGLAVEYVMARRTEGWRMAGATMQLQWLDGVPLP